MEICDECGQTIAESKWEIKRFDSKPYCSKCHEEVSEKFCLGG